MRTRLLILALVFGWSCGGLPTEPVPGNCAKDDQCPAGWKCGTDQTDPATFYRCFCAAPGCRDAGVGSDGSNDSDAPVPCTRSEMCPPGRTICGGAGVCVECTEAAAHCKDPSKSFCSAGRCVGCAAAGGGACRGAQPVCDAMTGRCVECTSDDACSADPDRPFCIAGACVDCGRKAPGSCAGKDASRPVCSASGACVECTDGTVHCKDPAKAFCMAKANVCVSCMGAGPGACKAPTSVCDAGSGRCVECTSDAQCSGDPSRPLCLGNACVACTRGQAGACAAKNATQPVCSPQGPCLECVTSTQCTSATKPICTADKCVPCTADAQCADKAGPGVCMSHQDGRCATELETIYVQNTPTCSSASASGTPTIPFCKPQDALGAVTPTRRLVLITGPAAVAGFTWSGSTPAQLSVIGRSAATVAGGADPGMRLTGGEVYARGLVISPSADVGIHATTGTVLRLERVTVQENMKGGVLLEGAAFDLLNTRIVNNGPGQIGPITWGGILVQNLPSSGPARLELVTVEGNRATGITCAGPVSGVGVLAVRNAALDVSSTCNVMACGVPSSVCGAQP